MPLAFDTGAYKETDIWGSLGTRDRADEPWRYGVFVPAQAVLHTFSTDGRTLLTVVFRVSPRHHHAFNRPKRPGRVLAHTHGPFTHSTSQGERTPIHTCLPLGHELDSVCTVVGERYVTIGLAGTEGRESLCVLQFTAAAPRNAFVARARDPEAALDGFRLHRHEEEESAPERRPVTQVPTTDVEWRERRHAMPLGIRDIALDDLQAFCDSHGIRYGRKHTQAMVVELIIIWIDHNLVGC